jgi:transcriptional regulator with XRE-family HTH domain
MNKPLKLDKRLVNQTEISRRIGLSQSYVNMLLNGKRKNQKALDKIYKIIRELKAA